MNKEHPSILKVLGWRLALVSVITLAAMVVLVQARLQSMTDALFHQALADRARDVATWVKLDADGKPAVVRPSEFEQPPRIVPYRLLDDKGDVLSVSGPMVKGLPRNLEPTPGTVVDDPGISGITFFTVQPPTISNHLAVASYPFQVNGQPVVVQVFESLDIGGKLFKDVVRDFSLRVGWLLVPFLIVLLVVSLFSIWTELRPLRKASSMAAGIGPETASERLSEEGQPREVLPLISGVNRALERLDQGFQMQRQFTADAAHELRTPLAVLNAHLDTLADNKAVTALRQEVTTMSRLVGQLLRIAQLDALTIAPSDRVDLHAVAVDTASALAPLALKAGKSIEMIGAEAPVWVQGDPEALSQAIRNLIENALHHTPKGTTVEIALGQDRSLRVSDRGPGVAPEQRELIFRRFWRASRRAGGAGLGLAIVAKVAETHGGTIHVEDASGGGACFVFTLPAPPALAEPAAPPEKKTAPERSPRQSARPAA